jgi:hypothetical protein
MIKITDLVAQVTIESGDVFAMVDVNDATQAASGSTKKLTIDTLEAYLNSNLTFLSSGDNVSELTNDAGYLTSVPVGDGGIYGGSGTIPTSVVATMTDDFTLLGKSILKGLSTTISDFVLDVRDSGNNPIITAREDNKVQINGGIGDAPLSVRANSNLAIDSTMTLSNLSNGVQHGFYADGRMTMEGKLEMGILSEETIEMFSDNYTIGVSTVSNGIILNSNNITFQANKGNLGSGFDEILFKDRLGAIKGRFNTTNGRFGIGVTPDTLLHVAGSIKMEDGNEQAGYVMTSDANGM